MSKKQQPAQSFDEIVAMVAGRANFVTVWSPYYSLRQAVFYAMRELDAEGRLPKNNRRNIKEAAMDKVLELLPPNLNQYREAIKKQRGRTR